MRVRLDFLAHLIEAGPRHLIRISIFRISKDILNQNHLSFERLNGKQTIVIPLDTGNARALLRICKYHKKDKGSPFTISEEIPVAVVEVVPVE